MSFTVRRLHEERPSSASSWRRVVLRALRTLRTLLPVLRRGNQKAAQEYALKRRLHLCKRILVLLVACMLALFVLASVGGAMLQIRILRLPQIFSVAGTAPASDDHGRTNLLLLGQGDEDYDGKDLTDSIIVASLDPIHTHSVALLSLPRDLYFLRTEKLGEGRLNTLYRDRLYALMRGGQSREEASLQAMRELANEIGSHLHLPIHAIVKVDFTGFVEAVDTLGGVDVVVPEEIVDPHYPGPNYTETTFRIAAGPAHLDGVTALQYVRSRHTTSDFSRSARQQQILRALGEKATLTGLIRRPRALADLLATVRDHVETTLSLSEIVGLAGLAATIPGDRVSVMQLSDRNGLYDAPVEPGGFLYAPPRAEFDGASVLLPVSIPEFPVTWKQITVLADLLFRVRTPYLVRPRIVVLNAGATSGLGRKLSSELTRFGFTPERVANATLDGKLTSSIVVAGSVTQDTATFFATLLGFPLAPAPVGLPPEEQADVTILLGRDYRFRPLQSLHSPPT